MGKSASSSYTGAIDHANTMPERDEVMVRSAACGATLALVLSACTGVTRVDTDPTPIAPTAVRETRTVNQGSAFFAGFESVTRIYSRPAMRRVQSSISGGTESAALADAGETGIRIERADRKRSWKLDAAQKTYLECPLGGCPGARKANAAAVRIMDAGCRLRIGITTLTLEPTGRKRSINGFHAEQYDIRWGVTFRDNASRVATSTVGIDLWLTPSTPVLDEALALEQAYARSRAAALGADSEESRPQFLPPEAVRMFDRLLAPNVSPGDRATFLAGTRKLDKLPGQPVLMNLKWHLSGTACGIDRTLQNGGTQSLFALSSEVKALGLEGLHDSLFAPPPEYGRKK